MNSLFKGVIALVGLVVVAVILYFVLYVSTNAKEQGLRISGKNGEKNCEQVLANTKLIIKGVGAVSKSQEATLLALADKVVQGRAGGGSFAKALTEAKIEIPDVTYKKLMTVIESGRKAYQAEQTKLLAIKTEHDKLVIHPFWSIFITDKSPLEVTIVTSSSAREAYQTGVDDDSSPYDAPPANNNNKK